MPADYPPGMRGNQVAISVGLGLAAFGLLEPTIGMRWTLVIIGAAAVVAGLFNRPLTK
jgi:H+/Cl- antiporter ClcA